MNSIHPLSTDIERPARFTYPFCYEPHPLCRMAAREVQAYIGSHPDIKEDADRGKMFGVLVVESPTAVGGYSFLAAYSGLLAGRNDWPYFVPPVYDAQQPDGHFKTREREISAMLASGDGGRLLAAHMSQELQLWLFHQYRLLNARGEERDLVDIWQSYYSTPKLQRKFPLPPGGTGDCCAPKLLQHAYRQGYRPVCMAEFWWGAATRTELRRHLNYYPACRGKCKPILTWMLQGLQVDPDPETLGFQRMDIPVVYEDAHILVINKPSGMLSVPGRVEEYSVATVMKQRYPESVVAHRLDMGTSGLLIVCKSMEAFHPLQEQFVRHEVKKKYIALLEPSPASPASLPPTPSCRGGESTAQKASPTGGGLEGAGPPLQGEVWRGLGTISLPMRPDPMNRPRQVVDMEHGKRAVTDYEFLTDRLVALYPQTGRTHQLRIHCAHPDGLNRPIVGDELYGTRGERLMLHAAEIWFRHPVTGQDMHLQAAVNFDV